MLGNSLKSLAAAAALAAPAFHALAGALQGVSPNRNPSTAEQERRARERVSNTGMSGKQMRLVKQEQEHAYLILSGKILPEHARAFAVYCERYRSPQISGTPGSRKTARRKAVKRHSRG